MNAPVGKVVWVVAAAAVGVAALSGCTKTAANLQVQPGDGGSVTGEYSFTVNLEALKQFAGDMGAAGDGTTEPGGDSFGEELRAVLGGENGEQFLGGLGLTEPGTVTLNVVDDGDEIGWAVTFDGTPLADYETVNAALTNASEDGIDGGVEGEGDETGVDVSAGVEDGAVSIPTIVEEGDGFRATLPNPFFGLEDLAAESNQEFTLPPAFLEAMKPTVNIGLEMPGKIVDTNTPDAVDGATVVWNNDTLGAVEGEQSVYVVSSGGSGFPWLPVAAGGLVLLFAAAGGVWLVARAGNKPGQGGQQTPPPPPGSPFGAPPSGQG